MSVYSEHRPLLRRWWRYGSDASDLWVLCPILAVGLTAVSIALGFHGQWLDGPATIPVFSGAVLSCSAAVGIILCLLARKPHRLADLRLPLLSVLAVTLLLYITVFSRLLSYIPATGAMIFILLVATAEEMRPRALLFQWFGLCALAVILFVVFGVLLHAPVP